MDGRVGGGMRKVGGREAPGGRRADGRMCGWVVWQAIVWLGECVSGWEIG